MAENYIVSARKYRPQTFDTVVGQEHITTTLKNAIRQQHLAHAYLFCGPRGVGKTTCARILARTINCENPTPDMEACGVCTTCTSFQDNTSFNIFELDAASNNSVDDIRNLTDQVRFAPQQGRYKIYIIDEVHMLSAAAFNAFLKTLEEPPPYAIFILATTEKHKILPTILSRCQIFDFKRITTGDIVGHLQYISGKENLTSDEAALHIIAQKSEGCMRDALSMIDRISSFTNGVLTYSNTMEHLNLLDADYYFSLTDYMLAQDVGGTLLLLDQALEKGFEGDVIINGLSEHFRNLLLCKDQRMAKLLDVPNDHKPVYFEKANYTPPSFILSALNVTNESELNYKSATNKRLHAELCLIRLCYILQATQPGNFSNGFADAEKKNNGSVVAPVQLQPAAMPPPQQMPPQATPAAIVPQVVNEPQPRQQYAPPIAAAAPVQTSPEPQMSVPAAVPSAARPVARRISKSFMDDIDNEINAGPQEKAAEKVIDQQTAEVLFEQYKKDMQAQQKLVLFAQLSMMKVEACPPDEIKMISPHEMTNEYALNHRNELIDYFRKETGILIRVTTEIQLNEEVSSEPGEKILTKTEIYEEMAKKNPYLAQLKEKLNLQIEF